MEEERASASQEIEEELEAGSSHSEMYISHRVSPLLLVTDNSLILGSSQEFRFLQIWDVHIFDMNCSGHIAACDSLPVRMCFLRLYVQA